MDKLNQLKTFVQGAGLCSSSLITVTTDEGTVEWDGATTGNGEYLYQYDYTGVFLFKTITGEIERYLALFVIWLKEMDAKDTRGNRITFEDTPWPDTTYDLEVRIKLQERVHFTVYENATPQSNDITLGTKTWRLEEESLNEAEFFTTTVTLNSE